MAWCRGNQGDPAEVGAIFSKPIPWFFFVRAVPDRCPFCDSVRIAIIDRDDQRAHSACAGCETNFVSPLAPGQETWRTRPGML